jgi:hypothetical protein
MSQYTYSRMTKLSDQITESILSNRTFQYRQKHKNKTPKFQVCRIMPVVSTSSISAANTTQEMRNSG